MAAENFYGCLRAGAYNQSPAESGREREGFTRLFILRVKGHGEDYLRAIIGEGGEL